MKILPGNARKFQQYHKNIAIHLLANLTKVDVDNKFEAIFEDFMGYLLLIRP